jgi:hypothetical protein
VIFPDRVEVVHCTSKEKEIVKRKECKKRIEVGRIRGPTTIGRRYVRRNETSEALPNEERGGKLTDQDATSVLYKLGDA